MQDGKAEIARSSRLTRLLLGLIGLSIVGDVLSLILDIAQHSLLADIQDRIGSYDLIAAAENNDLRQHILGWAYIAVFALTAIVALAWIRGSNIRARQLGATDMRFSPNWAVGWFFVPFANLVRPFQVVAEIWRASSGAVRWQDERLPPTFGWWWALYVVGSLVSRGAARLLLRADDIPEMMTATKASIAAGALLIAADLLFMDVVKKISLRQSARIDALPDSPVAGADARLHP